MGRIISGTLAGLAILLCAAPPAVAQTVLIRGRVEDAVSRRPLADVAVFSADSSTTAVTDPSGRFFLRVSSLEPMRVIAERLGYVTLRFDLPEGAASAISVLLLEPAPIEVEGLDVVAEAAVTKVLRDLEGRRNAYPGLVQTFDRSRLERVARFGSVWDFVRSRASHVFECNSSMSGLCARQTRGIRSMRGPPPESPVMVCIDGRESWGAVSHLSSYDIESVSLVEIYRGGRGGIRVYTPGYILSSARRGRIIGGVAGFGC